MNNLTEEWRQHQHYPRIRVPILRAGAQWSYERRIAGRWITCNHKRAEAIVAVLRRKYARLYGKPLH